MACSKSFFDDVKKELECSVCQEQFSEINEPKILKCLHTFCKTCLEAWIRQHREGELSCPTCRHITECPNSDINRLPSNLFYKQMLEIVETYSGQGQEDSPRCGSCDERKSLKFYCSDCNCFLCDDCVRSHNKGKIFKGHCVKEISNFKSSDVQDYARKASICKKHDDELRYYCDKCKICICRDCAILEHRDHNIISFEQGLDSKKSEITSRMIEVKAVGILLRQQKETLQKVGTRVNNSIDQATDEVHSFAEHCITLIRKHESAITKELLNHKASFSSELSSQMAALEEKMKDVNSSLEFGNDVLERNNLPEILNVDETLELRFQYFLSSPEFSYSIRMNNCGVKYEPRDVSNMGKELGKLLFSNTEPSLSIAQGKGLTEGLRGEDCNFTIVTKDWQGKTTYPFSEIDQITVDIQSSQPARIPQLSITDLKDGNYEVKYTPEDAGQFNVSIRIAGEAILGSPFQLKVKESMSRKVEKDEFLVTRKKGDLDVVTIIVSGVLPSRDAIWNYFENSRRSGGGEILEMVYNFDGKAVISFQEIKDLHRLLEGRHAIAGKNIAVERQTPKNKVPLDPRMIHIQGINETTSEDCLSFYLEKFTMVEVTKVIKGYDNNALIIFNDEPDFDVLFDKVGKDQIGLEGKHLRLERMPVCSCVYVKGLRKETSCETIMMYFQNHRKSGGGSVRDVEKQKNEALVYFKDPSSVQDVIRRIHIIDQRNLEVKPYYPFLHKTTTTS